MRWRKKYIQPITIESDAKEEKEKEKEVIRYCKALKVIYKRSQTAIISS